MTHEGRLRKVGGSVMLAIPPVVLDALGIAADAPVDLAVRSGRLVVEPRAKPRYTMDELLARCKPVAARRTDRVWTSGRRAGRELV
jgi:antitoxin ChpS